MVSESLDCGDCGQDSVDSVDCVSKLTEIHPDSGAVHGALGGNLEASHRPSSRCDISPSPYGAPLCLAPSLNVITQGARIAEEPDQQRMRDLAHIHSKFLHVFTSLLKAHELSLFHAVTHC